MKGAVFLLALCVVFAVVVAQPQPKWPPAWPEQFTITQVKIKYLLNIQLSSI